MARIVLLTPARRFIANHFGLGYQIPLNMVLLGGPLMDSGHNVRLIDNDAYGWHLPRLAREIGTFRPDIVLIGHTGSTAAHPKCLQTAEYLKNVLPQVKIVYGGVYPTYAADSTLRGCPSIDVVVRGEGEETVLELVAAWENGDDLSTVKGITFRAGDRILVNPPRPPIACLDDYRPGWELVDWPKYSLFGVGRSAGMQFSRGCPLTCTFCGQWMFWKRWRHRSPENFVAQLRVLAEQYGVKIVWLADENFGADRDAAERVLDLLIEAGLGISLNLNMTAADVVRDADLLPKYKAAGVDYVVMGVESLEDEVVLDIRKNNPFTVSKRAVALLRENRIISLCNMIYGLENETSAALWGKFRKLIELAPDILNAVYLTPHFWTKDGRSTDPADIIQPDLAKWTYRNQIILTSGLSPAALFAGVKLTEALFHLRPSGVKRLFVGSDARVRQILRSSLAVGARVVAAEIAELLLSTHFEKRGSMTALPDVPEKRQPVKIII